VSGDIYRLVRGVSLEERPLRLTDSPGAAESLARNIAVFALVAASGIGAWAGNGIASLYVSTRPPTQREILISKYR
jgi:hypothetical protein